MDAFERSYSPRKFWLAAGFLAGLAVLNLLVAGQPWGVVYGLGLWGAKLALVRDGFGELCLLEWCRQRRRLTQSLLLDITR